MPPESREEAVGEGLAQRQDSAARAALRLENRDVMGGLTQPPRGGQAREAGAEDENLLRCSAARERLRVEGERVERRAEEGPRGEGRKLEELAPVEHQNRSDRQLKPPSIFWNSDIGRATSRCPRSRSFRSRRGNPSATRTVSLILTQLAA